MFSNASLMNLCTSLHDFFANDSSLKLAVISWELNLSSWRFDGNVPHPLTFTASGLLPVSFMSSSKEQTSRHFIPGAHCLCFSIQITPNCARLRELLSHSNHVLSPKGAPGLVWKRTKKPPCQQELDPIDLVRSRVWLLCSHESKQTQQKAERTKTALKNLGVGLKKSLSTKAKEKKRRAEEKGILLLRWLSLSWKSLAHDPFDHGSKECIRQVLALKCLLWLQFFCLLFCFFLWPVPKVEQFWWTNTCDAQAVVWKSGSADQIITIETDKNTLTVCFNLRGLRKMLEIKNVTLSLPKTTCSPNCFLLTELKNIPPCIRRAIRLRYAHICASLYHRRCLLDMLRDSSNISALWFEVYVVFISTQPIVV